MKKDKIIDMIGQKIYIDENHRLEYEGIKSSALGKTKPLFDKADTLKDIFAWGEVYHDELKSLKELWWASVTKKYKLKKYHCSYYSEHGFMLILDQEDKK